MNEKELRAALGNKSFPQRTAKTLTKPAVIIREILAVRDAGYAVSDEELEQGMRSLAVPVFDVDAKMVAALSVSAYSARVTRSIVLKRFLPVVRECAAQLEERCFGQRLAPNRAEASIAKRPAAARAS
jgi:IclR family pca regulon transcriptional regulator